MSNAKITLYDIGTNFPGKTTSPFAFRIKIILSLKKIPYEARYLQPSQVESTAKSVGAPPTKTKFDGSGWYTVPFITFQEEGKETIALSDSPIIAEFLEKKYPTPTQPLFPAEDRVLHSLFSSYMKEKLLPFLPLISLQHMVHAPPQEELEWASKSRVTFTGQEFVPPTEEQINEAFEGFESFFGDLSGLLDKGGDGNCRITGGAVTFVEIELVGFILTMKVQNGKAWEILKRKYGGRFTRLVELPEYQFL